MARKINWRWWRAGTLSMLAEVAIADERIADARGLLLEALDLALQLGDRVGLSWYLSQFALVLLHESRPEEAGRIWGAVESAAVSSWLNANLSKGELQALRIMRDPFAMFHRGEPLALMPFTFLR